MVLMLIARYLPQANIYFDTQWERCGQCSPDHVPRLKLWKDDDDSVVRFSPHVQLRFVGEDGGGSASHKPVFGASVAAVQAGDTELVGAVGSQVGDKSFGHAGINVHFLAVVFDLW